MRPPRTPAIQAALDNPGYPRDPSVRWARTFPKIPRGPMLDEEVVAERRALRAVDEAVAQADDDPGAFQAVLACLEADPHPGVRTRRPGSCSAGLARNAPGRPCRPPQPRMKLSKCGGSARYASRLAERQTSTDAAGPVPG